MFSEKGMHCKCHVTWPLLPRRDVCTWHPFLFPSLLKLHPSLAALLSLVLLVLLDISKMTRSLQEVNQTVTAWLDDDDEDGGKFLK